MPLTPPTGGRALVADPAPAAPPFLFATRYTPGPPGDPGPTGGPGPAGSIGAPPCTITGTSAATVPLTIFGAAAQSSALQEWRDSGNALLASVDKNGGIFAGGGLYSAATNIPVSLRGAQADGASAVAVIVDNINTLSTAGAKLASFRNNGT
jgi:hypothetical protein